MHGKEFILACLRSFFAIVTLVNVAVFVLGFTMDPERLFGYEVFLMPLIYGALGILPNIVMYSKRELKIRELLVRKAIQLVLIEGLVLFAVFYQTAVIEMPLRQVRIHLRTASFARFRAFHIGTSFLFSVAATENHGVFCGAEFR